MVEFRNSIDLEIGTISDSYRSISTKSVELINLPKGVYKRKNPAWNKGLKGVLKGWNKGLTKETDARVAKISKSLTGRKLSLEHRRATSLGLLGRPSPRKGKTKENDEGVMRMALKRTREKHWNWKGGRRRNPYGYIKLWMKGHPHADVSGYVMEHILIMEKKLGRYLNKEEVVHHINEIKDDNRIENLELYKNTGEHSRYHRIKENAIKNSLER